MLLNQRAQERSRFRDQAAHEPNICVHFFVFVAKCVHESGRAMSGELRSIVISVRQPWRSSARPKEEEERVSVCRCSPARRPLCCPPPQFFGVFGFVFVCFERCSSRGPYPSSGRHGNVDTRLRNSTWVGSFLFVSLHPPRRPLCCHPSSFVRSALCA